MSFLIDTHAHIYYEDYANDLPGVINRAKKNNVNKIICVGTDIKTSQESLNISKLYDNIYCTVAIHPHEAKIARNCYISDLNRMAKNAKVVAIGESGLDYYYNHSSPAIQKKIFIDQIALSKDLDLPIVVHNRESDNDMIDILQKHKPTGVVHCFSGDSILAKKLIDIGFYISFTGIITFKNSTLSSIIKEIDMDRIMLETDSPYLTPVPNRGKLNEPSNVKIIAQKIAEIKELELEFVISKTTENALKLFDKIK